MIFNTTLSLDALRCWQPNEDADEPFLWTFFFAIDGSTVRQHSANSKLLLPSVIVQTGAGSHGNLPNPGGDAYDGEFDTIQAIPPEVGRYQRTLTPITIKDLENKVLMVPGIICMAYVLLEEDAIPDSAISRAKLTLRNMIEQRVNEFIADIDLITLTNAAKSRAQREQIPVEDATLAELQEQFGPLEQQLIGAAEAVVRDAVILDADLFGLIGSAVDPDDKLGAEFKYWNEKQIIQQNLSTGFHADIKPLNEDGQWAAVYELWGSLSGQLIPQPSIDFRTRYRLLSSQVRQQGEIDIEPALCMPPGPMQWDLLGNAFEYEIRFHYPFVDVRWTVNGVGLDSDQGTVPLTVMTQAPVAISVSPFVEYRDQMRQVNLRYGITKDATGRSLHVYNDPADGNYMVRLGRSLLLPNGTTIPAGSSDVTFDGLAIESPSLKGREDCMTDLSQVGLHDRGKRFITKKDLWGPYARVKTFVKIKETLQQTAIAENWSEEKFTRWVEQAKEKLKMA